MKYFFGNTFTYALKNWNQSDSNELFKIFPHLHWMYVISVNTPNQSVQSFKATLVSFEVVKWVRKKYNSREKREKRKIISTKKIDRQK